jgi:LacI family transcriptional regulator
MPRSKTTVTIQDVAKAAGVSVSTVSRVLNDKDDVAFDTLAKVQAVISNLGYTSSLAAKSLRSHKTNIIGLIMPDLEEAFSIQVVKGVSRAIRDLNYDLLVYSGGNAAREKWAAREQHYVSLLNGSIVDGTIVVTPTAVTFTTHSPLVAVDPHLDSAEFPAVISTNRAGALAAMEYLASLGHRRIGFIGGRSDLQSATRRLLGYKDGLQQANLPFDPELIQIGDFSQETGYLCAQKLLALPQRPSAIFAANDRSALGAIEAAQGIGLHVPHDLSVVGFDNILETPQVQGGLTTVDQSIDRMGYIAVEMLVNLIQGKALERNLYKIPTRLIVRGSCRAITSNISEA